MTHRLTEIKWNKAQNTVSLRFADQTQNTLSAEYLRIFSPSAEVRGHGGGEPMLVLDKEQVKILAIEPVGRYALKFTFDDGHDSGLYDWHTLHELCQNHERFWQGYLDRLARVGIERKPTDQPKTPVITDSLADAPSAQKSSSGAPHD
ncbi:MAG: gamma-butyrobetaine hydroxylase family protein [Halothiobacillus sp.]